MPKYKPKIPNSKVQKSLKKNHISKYILVLFIFLFLCSGLLFVVRGYFIGKDKLFDNSNLVTDFNNAIKFNNPIRRDNPRNTNRTESVDFGDNIKSTFYKQNKDKVWLYASNNVSKIIGYLDQSDNFNTIFNIPIESENIKLYEDESITYTLTENDSDTLYFVKPGQNASEIITLNSGKTFLSVFFEPETKSFFFTEELDDEVEVKSADLTGRISNVFDSSVLGSDSKIRYVNSTDLWFESKGECYILKFYDKSLNSFPCKFVRNNFEGVNYISNASNAGSYQSFITGEVFQINQSTQSEGSFFKGSQGEVFSKLNYAFGNIVFVRSNLQSVNSSTWVETPNSINILSQGQSISITNKLPVGNINNLVFNGEDLMIILEDNGKYFLMKYDDQNIPASYTSNSVYWKEIKLGITSISDLKFL